MKKNKKENLVLNHGDVNLPSYSFPQDNEYSTEFYPRANLKSNKKQNKNNNKKLSK